MQGFLIAFRLEPAPAGRLPPGGGLLDAAEEHGLWSLVWGPAGARPLPEGRLWGRFADARAALDAFDTALATASDLLGYPVRARGRLAWPAANLAEAENPFAQAEALLYLSYR